MPYTALSDLWRQPQSLPYLPLQTSFDAFAITPNDAADLPTYARRFTCNGAGVISVVPMRAAGETPVLLTLAAGQWVDLAIRKVNLTGTTATGIVGAT
jgi:hypothetical protein